MGWPGEARGKSSSIEVRTAPEECAQGASSGSASTSPATRSRWPAESPSCPRPAAPWPCLSAFGLPECCMCWLSLSAVVRLLPSMSVWPVPSESGAPRLDMAMARLRADPTSSSVMTCGCMPSTSWLIPEPPTPVLPWPSRACQPNRAPAAPAVAPALESPVEVEREDGTDARRSEASSAWLRASVALAPSACLSCCMSPYRRCSAPYSCDTIRASASFLQRTSWLPRAPAASPPACRYGLVDGPRWHADPPCTFLTRRCPACRI